VTQGRAPIAGLSKCSTSYSSAAVDKISTDIAHHMVVPSVIVELLVLVTGSASSISHCKLNTILVVCTL